jgi:xylulokinase
MYSLYKLLWIKNNCPEVFAKGKKVALNCDYLGFLLTGERVIDYGLAARTGVFDIAEARFSDEILARYGLSGEMFSTPARTGTVVGELRDELKKEFGIEGSCKLVLGSHDQICTSLGAGVLREGDAVDGLGTVECITTVFSKKPTDVNMGLQGYPCVPYAVDGLYCTYILNYSSGSTVNWVRKSIMHGYRGEEKDFFTYIEKGMTDKPTGLLLLPYFGGAATPYQDINAKGAIVGLTTETTDSDLYKSVMEGTAMEMRLNAEVTRPYGIDIKSAVATGGGANSARWLQLKANIQNIPFKTLRSSEGGLCGCAMLQAVALGQVASLEQAAEIFIVYGKEYTPENAVYCEYEGQYQKYKKLYQTVKEIY